MKILYRRFEGRPEIDMTPDGQIMGPAAPSLAAQLFRVAVVVAVLAAALALAAVAFWFALVLIPVAIVAGLVAYGAFRWRVWQATRRY